MRITILLAALALTSAASAQQDTSHRNVRVGGGSSRAGDRRNVDIPTRPEGAPVFIENRGQWPSTVRYLLKANGIRAWLTADGVVYDFQNSSVESDTIDRGRSKRRGPRKIRTKGHVISLRFENADTTAVSTASEPTTELYNYFIGSDTSRWASRVRSYHRVVTHDVYDGIDAVYYTDEGNPRYDLVVRPGARPDSVRLKIQGARRIRVDADGQLRMESSIGDLYQGRPVAYQIVDGARVLVPVAFDASDTSRIRFAVGAYDTTRPLVIDPIVYSTFVGGTSADHSHGVAVDDDENVYVVGYSQSINFPVTTGAYDITGDSGWDAVVTCLDRLGNSVRFSTYYGGSQVDLGTSIAVRSSSVTISGNTTSNNLAGVTGGYDTSNNMQDAFAARFSMDGTTLLGATYLGGSDEDWSNGIAVNSLNQVVIVGGSRSTDFPMQNAVDSSSASSDNGFLSILSSDLSTLVSSTYINGSGNDYVDGVALGDDDVIHVVGGTTSTNFATTTGAAYTTKPGGMDAFYRRYDTDGNPLLYSSYLGGSGEDRAFAVAVDTAGNAWLTGFTTSSGFPALPTGVFQSSYGGSTDAFVSKFSSSGTLAYSTFLGGSSSDTAYAIAVDGDGNAYVCGVTSSGFPTLAGSFDVTYGGAQDGFVSVLNASGTALRYSTYLGDSLADRCDAVALFGIDRLIVTGSTTSPNFPTTYGTYDGSLAGSFDLTLTRLYTLVDTTRDFIGGYINDYFAVVGVEPCGECIYLSGTPNAASHPLESGDRILLMQMAGAEFAEKNDRNYGTVKSYGRAGLYEFATVASLSDVTFDGHDAVCVLLNAPRVQDYRHSQLGPMQMIRVPQFINVDVALLTAPRWTGSTGGVVAFEASGEVRVLDDIDVSGAGFTGGAAGTNDNISSTHDYGYVGISSSTHESGSKGEGIGRAGQFIGTPGAVWKERGPSVSGGGGGNALGAGGGGGSNFGVGGSGGWQAIGPTHDGCGPITVGGLGGRALTYEYGRSYPVFMGGGGGGGHVTTTDGSTPPLRAGGDGGAGGGIVVIRAGRLVGVADGGDRPAIRADGVAGGTSSHAGAGGAGAGGAILLGVAANWIIGDLLITANGGAGGSALGTTSYCYGPGGGGGAGYIHVGPSGVDNARILFQRAGGAAGLTLDASGVCSCSTRVSTYGAQPGGAGEIHFAALTFPGSPMPISALRIDYDLEPSREYAALTRAPVAVVPMPFAPATPAVADGERHRRSLVIVSMRW